MEERKITERENALKAYRHQKPDWIPLFYDAIQYIGFIGGNECGLGEVAGFGTDKRDVFSAKWSTEGQPTPDPNEPPLLADIAEWQEKIKFPKPSEWDWEGIRKFELANYNGEKLLIWFGEQGLFDRLTVLLGFENALCSLLMDPESCAAFFDRLADYKIELVECVAKYIKPDVFMYTDDLATSTGLFIRPELYRSLIKPSHARIIEAINQTDMIAEQHTCGKCDDIIPDYVEMGVESFFPAQSVNDLESIQKKYGDRLTLCGGFNSQGHVGRTDATEEELKAEARRMIDAYGKNDGFCALPIIMDNDNWTIYHPSPNQKIFRDEFYRYSKEVYNAKERA